MDTHAAAYASLPHLEDDSKPEFRKKYTDEEDETPTSGRGSFIIEVTLIVICILGHVALVTAFVVLIIIRHRRDGKPLNFDDNKLGQVTGYLYQRLANKPSAIIKVYLVPLLYLTQKLALRRNVRARQTLTAMDDQASAWLGLGATVPVLWRYHDMFSRGSRATRSGDLKTLGFIMCIIFYLAASLLLGIVATDLFIFANAHGTNGYQNLTAPALMTNMSENAGWVEEAFPIISVLPLLNSLNNVVMTTTGLVGPAVYDVPNYSTTLDLLSVNALGFQADCKTLPNAKQNSTFDDEDPHYYIHIDDSLDDFEVALTSRSLGVVSTNWTRGGSPATVFVASTMPILDDSNTTAPSTAVSPTIVPWGCKVDNGCTNVTSIQLLACDLNYTQQTLQLDTSVFPAGVYGNVLEPDTSSWREWSPQAAGSLNSTLPVAWQFGALSHRSQYTEYWKVGDVQMHYHPTLLEETLMEILGFYDGDVSQVHLSRLDSLLAQAFALVYWRTAVSLLQKEADQKNLPPDSALARSHVKDLVQIDPIVPWESLVLSIIMLCTAAIVIQQPRARTKTGRHHKLNGLGVLEMTWLLGRDERDVAGEIAEVREPSLQNLRQRGKHLTNPYCGI
ncbi:hypothetical protein PsYK624_097990 [Phanerochaete sordida]|uniref:Uncharacterized protein n=1 Tax=Phanerochaete sordida TaxID=48140 RepID=A0A9P3LGH7_9APHY|nr:hypothetical protein PsYK624_097990 [Phanerochaete sordida]